MSLYEFHPSIVREYDMRGLYGQTLTESDAYWLGRTFADWIEGGRVACARDGRNSSPSLQAELIRGLTEGGCDVVNIGIGPTPMLYFGVKTLDVDAGIMVTGSHNPKDHNGFKMMRAIKQDGGSVHGQQIRDLAVRVKTLPEKSDAKTGNISTKNIKPEYIKSLIEKSGLDVEKGFKEPIIWDCGNGAAGAVINELTARINAKHTILYPDLDGDFPNHDPDPTVEKNLSDLKMEVLAKEALVGLAFDGDADRLGVIDNNGRFIAMDDLICVLAQDVLKTHQGAAIIADVKCAPHLFEEVNKEGGRAILWKTGHSPIKAKMIAENAPFAGEYSGHIFFADHYFGFDDGLYAGLRLLNILQKTNKSLSEILAHLPSRVAMPELRLDVSDDEKFALVTNFTKTIQKHVDFPKNGVVHTMDGIRVETPTGWLLMRASNTQGAVVIRVEAQSDEALSKLRALIADVFVQLNYQDLADKVMS